MQCFKVFLQCIEATKDAGKKKKKKAEHVLCAREQSRDPLLPVICQDTFKSLPLKLQVFFAFSTWKRPFIAFSGCGRRLIQKKSLQRRMGRLTFEGSKNGLEKI